MLTLCWCLFFFFCSSQGGAVFVTGGSASFLECSFSGNTATNNVSSLLLNSLIDLVCHSLFLCFCIPPSSSSTFRTKYMVVLFFFFSSSLTPMFWLWWSFCCFSSSSSSSALFFLPSFLSRVMTSTFGPMPRQSPSSIPPPP